MSDPTRFSDSAVSRHSARSYEFDPFRLDVAKRLLLREGQPVALTQRLFETLLALVENSGRVISKDELMSRLWPETAVEEANLTVNISALRKVLGETAGEHRFIATIPGRGYQFVATVRREDEESSALILEKLTSAEIIIEEREEDPYSQSALREGEMRISPRPIASPVSTGAPALDVGRGFGGLRLSVKIAAGCAVAFAIACAFWFAYFESRTRKTSGAGPISVAVLPFKMLGNNNSDEYRGAGMADALITRLGALKQVNVRPTSAVLKYAGVNQDSLAAGRELNVEAVLEGSIRESGDMVRITAQLVSVETGLPIWTDKFDESPANVFAAEDRVSAKVADAIAINLTGEEKLRLAKRYTENFEAYQEYLKGRFYANRRTPETIKTGIQHFERAIEIDQGFALAYAAIADSYALLGLRAYSVLAPHDAMPKAKTAALRALEIDDGLAEAHNSLAQVKMRYEWDWPGAEREFKRAIELNPGYAFAHQIYADLLFVTGRSDEALAEVRLAQKIDPSALTISASHALYLYFLEQPDEALAQCEKALEKDPNLYTTRLVSALAYEQKGMHDQAITEARKAVSMMPGKSGEAIIGYIYARQGKTGEALKVIERFKQSAKHDYVDPIYVGVVYSGLQDAQQSLLWLEKAYGERSPALIYLKYDPRYIWLRSNPGFQDLLRRVGLAPARAALFAMPQSARA
jgi:DNA-binding winged helix-turn-helix (wHTH) protein/TolB-like protein/Tfp pilus assembly protein PilF